MAPCPGPLDDERREAECWTRATVDVRFADSAAAAAWYEALHRCPDCDGVWRVYSDNTCTTCGGWGDAAGLFWPKGISQQGAVVVVYLKREYAQEVADELAKHWPAGATLGIREVTT
jgi:hypothetical protein